MNNNTLHIIDEKLKSFDQISLSAMDGVKLMDRIDSKFVISADDLLPLLKQIGNDYYVLTIGKNRIFNYRTEYFDTPELNMFSDHHNGKLNRFKIRQREYVESDTRFLEVKFKSNKGRLIKERVEITTGKDITFNSFIKKHTPYNPDLLKVTLVNHFNRFTLVDRNLQERATVDLNLSFNNLCDCIELNGVCIIELKQNKSTRESSFYNALKKERLRPDSFSKYCMGIALLNHQGKSNNFKRNIGLVHKLGKVETGTYSE